MTVMLRYRDGYSSTTPEKRDEVKVLQRMLQRTGASIRVDGLFGRQTESAVKAFQKGRDLMDDGVVGPLTWRALERFPAEYPTTFDAENPELLGELAQASSYEGAIRAAADNFSIPDVIIFGIGSRESGWGSRLRPPGPDGTGDFVPRRSRTAFRSGPMPQDGGGFGRGLMQIDYDAHAFARVGQWKDPVANIDFAASVLRSACEALRARSDLVGDALVRAAVAAYNCGTGNVLRAMLAGVDVDAYTTGRNYSADVLDRAGWLELRGGEPV